jgi:hypothetical protein
VTRDALGRLGWNGRWTREDWHAADVVGRIDRAGSFISRAQFHLVPVGASWMDSDRHFDLLAEPGQNRHQAVDGEAVELRLADAGEIRCGDARQLLRGPHRQFPVVEHANDTRGQQRSQLLAVCFGVTEVAENIPAASDDSKIVGGHFNLAFSRFNVPGPTQDRGRNSSRLATVASRDNPVDRLDVIVIVRQPKSPELSV